MSHNTRHTRRSKLTFDAANLLAQPFRNYAEYAFNRQSRSYPRDVRDEGRYYGIGARFRF